MLTATKKSSVVSDMVSSFNTSLKATLEKMEAIEKVEAAGIELEQSDSSYLSYQHRVTREQLPLIRKIVGRVKVISKTVPYDFDRTGEVNVTVRPIAEAFKMLDFTYRTKFRNGGKCKVVETQSSTYKTIVCEK
jgi:hypothetical protein